MGLLSGLGGGIIGALSSAWQADKTADMQDHAQNFTRDQSQAQMAFQERMRSTQYQTATDDMQKAGLNPMLAYQQGGAGTPAGAGGGGTGGSVARPEIMQAAASAANVDLIDAQTRKVKAEAAIIEDQVASDDPAKPPKTFAGRENQFKVEQAWHRAKKLVGEVELTNEQINHVKQQIANAITRNELDKLDIPKAINEAAAQGSAYMKHIAPYTGELGKLTNSAADIARARRGFNWRGR